jgi:myo-inositol-1(or 4)-monophosphatase
MDKKLNDQCLKVALEAAISGGKIALKYFRKLKHVSHKLDAGLVSEADRESEACILQTIRKKFPKHRFLGEESGFAEGRGGDSEPLWIVDPLDGTTNYVHGFPFFCVSIGVEFNGQIEVAVVHAPLLKYTYTAQRGRGAFLNKKPMYVSSTAIVDDSLLATGFSYKKSAILEQEIRDFKALAEKSRGIRRAGSAALDLCMVASGIFDGFWERELASWDTAAGSLLVTEAGGVVTGFDGKPFNHNMKTILAGNKKIHSELLKVVGRN